MHFEGMRFVNPKGKIVRVIRLWGDGQGARVLGSDFYEESARFWKFDDETPLELVSYDFLSHNELCHGGHTFNDFLWRRDYSHELSLLFALKYWTNERGDFLPAEIARLIYEYYLQTQREIARDYAASANTQTIKDRKAHHALALPWQVLERAYAS